MARPFECERVEPTNAIPPQLYSSYVRMSSFEFRGSWLVGGSFLKWMEESFHSYSNRCKAEKCRLVWDILSASAFTILTLWTFFKSICIITSCIIRFSISPHNSKKGSLNGMLHIIILFHVLSHFIILYGLMVSFLSVPLLLPKWLKWVEREK